MTEKKTIYELELHESIIVESIINNGEYKTSMLITRVPGGFIYCNREMNSHVFVPFNGEFEKTKNDKKIDPRILGSI